MKQTAQTRTYNPDGERVGIALHEELPENKASAAKQEPIMQALQTNRESLREWGRRNGKPVCVGCFDAWWQREQARHFFLHPNEEPVLVNDAERAWELFAEQAFDDLGLHSSSPERFANQWFIVTHHEWACKACKGRIAIETARKTASAQDIQKAFGVNT
ncbi:hypothetical protein HY493_04895 [Candidatus Woesearchaeota archaeon]|nr:hypothetical protein [Candidatus Woesearchaeota archaeon]